MNPILNDVNISIATVNGSGSQSANQVLMRAIFNMGVPVSGKNVFPSNISGLPTFYTIRVNRDGFVARKEEVDLLVAMNPQTVEEDIRSLRSGAFVLMNESLSLPEERDDLTIIRAPFGQLVSNLTKQSKLRRMLVNMIYAGIVAELLGIEQAALTAAVTRVFGGKDSAIELNLATIEAGRAHARSSGISFPYRVEAVEKTGTKILVDGNTAAGMGSVFGGLSVLSWYPITPSSSLCEAAIDILGRLRHDEDGLASYAVVQAEDEIAAAGIVIGAGWAGARSMTATSGPGISLMSELVGLAYFAEIPAVIWDVQRVGPSTGLPTRTAQGDISMIVGLSHGDTKHIVLIPGNVGECFELALEALDLAEEFQTPVFVLSDVDLGMNIWMSDPFDYPEKPMSRGKVLSAEDLERVNQFQRYADVDGDGIPYRTLPGTDHHLAPYFCRGSGHNEAAQYTESSDEYARTVERLSRKYESARFGVPEPAVDDNAHATVGIIAFGSTDSAVPEARHGLRENGVETSYLRIRALPLHPSIRDFVDQHDVVYVVEQNRDGQMADQVRLHCRAGSSKIRSILLYNGQTIDAQTIVRGVLAESPVEAGAK